MRRAILRDIHDLCLDPTKRYDTVGAGGRLKASTPVSVSIVVEPTVEPVIELTDKQVIPETVIVEEEQVQPSVIKEEQTVELVENQVQDEVKTEQPKKRQRKSIGQTDL